MSAGSILGSTAAGAGAGAAAGPIGAAVGAGVGLLGGLAAYFIGRPSGDPAAAARLQAQRAADLNRRQMMAMAAGARGPGGPIAAMRQAGAQASQVNTQLQSNAMSAAADATARRDAMENQRVNQILGGTISAVGSGVAQGIGSASGASYQDPDPAGTAQRRQDAMSNYGTLDSMSLSDERRKRNVSGAQSAIQRYLDSLPGAASIVVRDSNGRELGTAGLRRSPPPPQAQVQRPGPMVFQRLDQGGNPVGQPAPRQGTYQGDQMVYRDEATGHTTQPDPMTYMDVEDARKGGGVESYLNSVKPVAFDYKAPQDGPGGRQYGVMAQDLASTPVGAQAVVETPRGLAIDPARAIGPVMAAQGQLNERIRRLEGGQPLIGADDQARMLAEASISAGQASAPYASRPRQVPRGPVNMEPMTVRGTPPPPGPDPMEEARYSYMMQNIAGRLPSGRQADREERIRSAVSDAKRDMNTGHDSRTMRWLLSMSPNERAVAAREDSSLIPYLRRIAVLESDSGRAPSSSNPRGL